MLPLQQSSAQCNSQPPLQQQYLSISVPPPGQAQLQAETLHAASQSEVPYLLGAQLFRPCTFLRLQCLILREQHQPLTTRLKHIRRHLLRHNVQHFLSLNHFGSGPSRMSYTQRFQYSQKHFPENHRKLFVFNQPLVTFAQSPSSSAFTGHICLFLPKRAENRRYKVPKVFMHCVTALMCFQIHPSSLASPSLTTGSPILFCNTFPATTVIPFFTATSNLRNHFPIFL